MQHYYFDHNATTPVAPEVLRDLTATLVEVSGNASSIHHFGQAAKQRLESARREVAARFSAQRMVENTIKVYEEVLREARKE